MMNIFDRINATTEVNESAIEPRLDEPSLSPDIDPILKATTSDKPLATDEIRTTQPITTRPIVKELTQELIKSGFLEEVANPAMFKQLILAEREVTAVLEPLDLALRLDTLRGVAVVVVARTAYTDSADAWSHALIRRQRLTLEQSLLIAILRQLFAGYEQETGVGHGIATFAVDDIAAQFRAYFKGSGSDTRDEARVLSLLDQLKTYGVVSEVNEKEEITIRPLIAHLANPESLTALLRVYQNATPADGCSSSPESEAGQSP